jgi:hypothetical protein
MWKVCKAQGLKFFNDADTLGDLTSMQLQFLMLQVYRDEVEEELVLKSAFSGEAGKLLEKVRKGEL